MTHPMPVRHNKKRPGWALSWRWIGITMALFCTLGFSLLSEAAPFTPRSGPTTSKAPQSSRHVPVLRDRAAKRSSKSVYICQGAGRTPVRRKFSALPRGGTGHVLADRLWRSALACGQQTPDTISPFWKMVQVGQKGCVMWAPPSWVVLGAGQNITSVQEDRTGNTGFLVMAGVPAYGVRVVCTPRGITRFMMSNIVRWGCHSLKTLYYRQGYQSIAGLNIPKADYIYQCTTRGVQKIGYLWISIHGTMPLCNMMVMGYWMPVRQIKAKVCTLTQIFQSISCPKPCDTNACRAKCIRRGKRTGWCYKGRCICR